MSAADIRLLVERCYDPEAMQRVIAHRGNPLDGLNPNVPPSTGSGGPITPPPLPGDVIRNLVGRCYSDPVPNKPNPKDQEFPPRTPEEPEPPPVDPPGEIIRTLVGRCYGPPPPPFIPDPPDDPIRDITRIDMPPWVPWIVEITGIDPPPMIITLKPPEKGSSIVIITGSGDPNDCDLVAEFLKEDMVKALPDYSQDGKGPPGWWEHKETK